MKYMNAYCASYMARGYPWLLQLCVGFEQKEFQMGMAIARRRPRPGWALRWETPPPSEGMGLSRHLYAFAEECRLNCTAVQ